MGIHQCPCGLPDMSEQRAFERILASLYDAMLDDTRWPSASALIDEACGITGNDLMVGEGPTDDVRARFVGAYWRGQRREDLEREYLQHYHPTDERVPRFRQLPDSRLVHVTELYTAEELKTSPTYNEVLVRAGRQDAVNTRLDGPDGSHITWGLGDPVDSAGWGASRIALVTELLPHIRQFVRVRQALVRADARHATVTALLDNPRIGVVHLDRRGRILAVNDRARSLLRHGEGLSDVDGVLQARAPDDQCRLAQLVAEALPTSSAVAVSGSMLLVVRHLIIFGYTDLSLQRASSTFICQSTPRCVRLTSVDHADTSSCSVPRSPMRRPRTHWRVRELSSFSAMFSQLPCFGV